MAKYLRRVSGNPKKKETKEEEVEEKKGELRQSKMTRKYKGELRQSKMTPKYKGELRKEMEEKPRKYKGI